MWNELGLIFTKTDFLEEAEEAFSKAIEIDHGFGRLTATWVVDPLQGRFKDAIAMLTRSLELLKDPRDQSAAWNRLGDVRRQMNNYEAAMFAYQKADLNPAPGLPVEMQDAEPAEIPAVIPLEFCQNPNLRSRWKRRSLRS